jgi:hypothetical protein
MSNVTVGTLSGLSANGNKVTMASGHTLYTPGHIIQVVTVENMVRYSQGFSDSVALEVSGMSASITPKSTNSKILVMMRWSGEFTAADRVYNSVFYVTRNGTKINTQSDPASQVISGLTVPALSYEGTDASSTMESASLFTTDSPGASSEQVYKLVLMSNGAGGTLHTNRTVGYSGQTSAYELATSSIVLMEIAQ